jgi:hypothetical protein
MRQGLRLPLLLAAAVLLPHAISAADTRSGYLPYGPHDAPHGAPFFQGWCVALWVAACILSQGRVRRTRRHLACASHCLRRRYTRITLPEDSVSLAVVIGEHLPAVDNDQHDNSAAPARTAGEHDVLCMLLLGQRGEKLRVKAHYFDRLDVITQPTECDNDVAEAACLQPFELLTQGPLQSSNVTAQPSCVMRVSSDRIDIQVDFPGVFFYCTGVYGLSTTN